MYDNQDNWLELLDSVLFAKRVSQQKSTGYSPFRLLYGCEPILPFHMEDNIMRGNPVPPTLQTAFNNVVVGGITVDGDILDGITKLDNSISSNQQKLKQYSNIAPTLIWHQRLLENELKTWMHSESNRKKSKITNISGKILQLS